MSDIPEIHIAPQTVMEIGSLPISNAVLASFGISLVMIVGALLMRRQLKLVPGRLQAALELTVNFFLDILVAMFGSEKQAKRFFPLIFTIFVFLVISNQFALIPFVETIVTEEGVRLFRAPSSHYALPIAWALVVLLVANGVAFFTSPLRHVGNFIKVKPFLQIRKLKDIPFAFLEFYLGIMDIIGEAAKLISLSTRLFGNILAGQIIFVVISGLMVYTHFIVPLPFVALGILAGFVQAFVFAMLSAAYISSSVNSVQAK